MAVELLFLDQSRIIPEHLGVIYRNVVEVCRGEEIEIFIDQLHLTLIHAKIHVLAPEFPEPAIVWITGEILRQWGEQQKLSVKETRRRLKILQLCMEKLVEVEVLNVYILVSRLLPSMYAVELKAVDNPEPMTLITGKCLKPGEKLPLRLLKLTPLSKELRIVQWRKQLLGRMGALSKWKEHEPITGEFVGLELRKKLHKIVFRDGKDLLVPICVSDLTEKAEIHDRKRMLKDYPYLKSNPFFHLFKGFLDEDQAVAAAVNAAEVEEIKK